jgi:hypothetical protein
MRERVMHRGSLPFFLFDEAMTIMTACTRGTSDDTRGWSLRHSALHCTALHSACFRCCCGMLTAHRHAER